MLFDFLGYNKTDGVLDENRCSSRNATLVIRVLENVMDKTNYAGRYERFMWDLYARFKTKKPDLANQISEIVRKLTPWGTPTGN